MATELIITNERVDDIPLLLAQIERMGIKELVDKHFSTHGNWQGESLGSVVAIWLIHILSQADHSLNQVQGWTCKRLETLKAFCGESLHELDLTDDRLEAVLRYLDSDRNWYSFEEELGGSLLQVYDITPQRVRMDSTTASSYCGVNPEGLFQWGHNKDHRPDLAQVKIMLSTLDPLGMPIATEILSGEKADDPLYIPAIDKVRSTLKQPGLLYIGDCKMSSIATRTHLVLGGDFYLCPLNAKQVRTEKLEEYLQLVWDSQQKLTTIDYDYADGKSQDIAEGFEINILGRTTISSTFICDSADRRKVSTLTYTENFAISRTTENTSSWREKLTNHDEWSSSVDTILKHYRTTGLLEIDIQTKQVQKVKKRYQERPSQTVQEVSFELNFQINEDAVRHQIQLLDWRVYVTNKAPYQFDLKQAVRVYRDEYLIERGFARLKNFPLSLTPMYLQREDHITGLIRLLSIGLRVLNLLEFQVRKNLEKNKEKLAGLYVGNPKRETARPTAEILLAAFKEITLLLIEVKNEVYAHLTTLSPLQQRILVLLEFPTTIYTQLDGQSFTPE